MDTKDETKLTDEDIRNLHSPRMLSWKRSPHEMTEEEIEKFTKMNWEWYYNCYLYLDEVIPVMCKRCGHFNVFQPGEKVRRCENCGDESKRCEKEEDLTGKSD